MEICQAKDIFMLSRKGGKLSKRTLLWYDEQLNRFITYANENGINKVEQVSRNIISDYLYHLLKGMKGVTACGHYRALRAFFNFLFDEEYISRNPIQKVKAPKAEQKFMRTFSKVEISQILKHYSQSDFFGARNYTIMSLLFSTGLRKSELLNIKIKDVNLDVDAIRIIGKGSKERTVPIGTAMRRIILRYKKWREEFLDGNHCEFFIITREKQQMKISGLNTIFSNLKKDLSLGGEKLSPHTWRHTFAKTFLLNGGDIFSLQKILGHSDISTTKRYIHLNDKELKLQHSRYNPLDNSDWAF